MFAPFRMGGAFGSSDWVSGRRGPMLRKKPQHVEDAAEKSTAGR